MILAGKVSGLVSEASLSKISIRRGDRVALNDLLANLANGVFALSSVEKKVDVEGPVALYR